MSTVSASTSELAPMSTIISSFHELTRLLETKPIHPLIVQDIDGKNVSLLFQHEAKQTHKAYCAMKNMDHCHMCAERHSITCAVSDMEGPIMMNKLIIDNTIESSNKYHKACSKMVTDCEIACKSKITGLILVKNDTLFGFKQNVGGWSHLCRPVNASDKTDATITIERQKLIEGAIERYISSDLFDRLMNRLISQGIVSINLMKTCLHKAAYGNKFLPAVEWLESILIDLEMIDVKYDHMNPKQKWEFLMKHIMRAALSKDSQGTVALLFQTAHHNVIDLLESAKSETAMIKLCEERLNPLNYQRPTAEPTDGDIDNCIKYLGDFENTLITVERAKILIPQIVHHGQITSSDSVPAITSSMSGFAAQRAKNESVSSGSKIKSFASKCASDELTIKINAITSVSDFIEFSRKHPEIPVQIAAQGSLVYAAETTLGDKVKHPHLWGFMNQARFTEFGINSAYVEVTHTVPMYEYIEGYKSVFWVCAGIKYNSRMGNCCFPEFLTSENQRTCRKSFEALNKTMPLKVPDGPLLMGVGASSINERNELSTRIILKINKINIVLTKL
jgi:hypothetical protein